MKTATPSHNAASAIKTALRRRRGWLPATFHPAQILVLSFALVIAIGTVLLASPFAVRSGPSLRLVDAFFTATSATCVTGLGVVDTGTRFSLFGQIVILCCIQIGGLGLMTFTTVFLVATGRRLAIADRIVIQESFHHSPTGKLGPLIRYIFVSTLITEAVGAALLMARWWITGANASVGEAAYSAIFHSISAFCNAGFSLYPDSLIRFQNDPYVLIVLSGLILAGGLGFLVGLDLKEYLQQSLFQARWSARVRERVEVIRPRPRLSLHTKMVLSMTGALLVIGTISYYSLERTGVLRDMSADDALLNAWFCSVTARTAGFNTIDYAKLGAPALLCTMVLMFIGASPGSAGGGVKTSTFGLLLLYAVYGWRGQGVPHAFRRSIPQETLDRASTVVVAAVGFVIVASSFLMATETRSTNPLESQASFLPVLFETFSGFGTVGLSMGITGGLTSAGKLVLCVVMFVGRVGPLTAALAVATRKRQPKISYAEENIMIG
jgi:trk system potassium uptake protein